MSTNKKLKGFKLHPKDLQLLAKLAKQFDVPQTTLIEVSLAQFFALPEARQRELLKAFLTRHLD